jgi:hypothetical protein
MYKISICGVDDFGKPLLSVTIICDEEPQDIVELAVRITCESIRGFHLSQLCYSSYGELCRVTQFLESETIGSCILYGERERAVIWFERKDHLTMDYSVGFMESNTKGLMWLLNCSAKKIRVRDVQVYRSSDC